MIDNGVMHDEDPAAGPGPGFGDNPLAGQLPHPAVMAHNLVLALNGGGLVSGRAGLAGAAGSQFGGSRNIYHVLGYPSEIQYKEYKDRYQRGGIAQRVVEAAVEDTWRHYPKLMIGVGDEASSDHDVVKLWDAAAKRLDVFGSIEQADALCGVGNYSILLIGVKGTTSLAEPIRPGSVKRWDDLIFLQAYDQGAAVIASLTTDPGSPNYGLPESYNVDTGGSQPIPVHHSRVIHIVEKRRFDRVLGQPRMQAVWNYLMDLDKVIGSSAEAYWKLVYKGLVMKTQEGKKLPKPGTAEHDAIYEKIDDYVNDLRRYMLLEGMDLVDMGSQNVDPSNLVDVLLTVLAATIGIPKRILMGSELGELASSQDAAHWAGRIAARRVKYAEGRILNLIMYRLISWGVVPAELEFSWQWRPLFELSDTDRSTAAKAYAEAMLTAAAAEAAGALDLAEFRQLLTPFTKEPVIELDPFDAEPDEPEGDEPEPDVAEEGDEDGQESDEA